MAKTVRKGLMGLGDIQMTPGNFSRTTSTGGTQTLSPSPVIVVDPNGQYTTIAAAYAAASNGDVIFIPRGNYTVALDALVISKPVRFVGAGITSTVITFTGASGVAFKFNYDSNAPTGSYLDWGMGIEDCQIIGPGTINGGASNAGTGIQIGDATHSAVGAYFRNVIIAGFDIGTTWVQGGPSAIASWGTKFDHVTWLNNDQQILFNYSGSGTGLAHIEFVHPTFNHFQSGVTVQANAVELAGTIGADFNFIDPYFQSDQLVVSNNRVKLINPTFENTNGQSTTTYVSHTGGHLEMVNPHFLQTSTGATVPTAYVTSSAGHLGMINPGGNNSSATTFPAIALSGAVNVDIYGFRTFTNASALFSGSTSGHLNSPTTTGRQQFGGNDLVDVNSTQTLQGKGFSDTLPLYNNIATVAGGVPAEYAQVNLTAQTAAVGTTTLYAVPASGAGQYRLSWNAKVTTPATTGAATSTLGALTIVYTDPDGVVQTITAPAFVAAGTIATSSTGNTTTTVLLGMPLLLNCKLSTNITYAMAYASDTANQMAYNLHIKLEAL